MHINACGNQLSNLGSSFSENSKHNNNSTTTNDSAKSAVSIFSEVFPLEVVREITNYADFDTSKILLRVSKGMNNVISSQNEERRKLVKGMAFGKEEWLKFYDQDIGNEPLFPRNIIEILKSVGDSFFLTLIPKGQSVKSFGELSKKYFPTSTGYDEDVFKPILEVLETPNDKSYWALMSKDVLNGSRGKKFEAQQKMVAEFFQNANVNCKVPTALEAVVSILTHHVRSGERLFSDNPITYTRCLDVYKGYQVVVGGFALSGLRVHYYYSDGDDRLGVAALRKFRPLVIG
ncbi:MAG: hypothetical protein H0W50_08605 [Parachlamydiaceae bacterium]|nr:hypothetical protein [Parachlamydiaceae bacterium]